MLYPIIYVWPLVLSYFMAPQTTPDVPTLKCSSWQCRPRRIPKSGFREWCSKGKDMVGLPCFLDFLVYPLDLPFRLGALITSFRLTDLSTYHGSCFVFKLRRPPYWKEGAAGEKNYLEIRVTLGDPNPTGFPALSSMIHLFGTWDEVILSHGKRRQVGAALSHVPIGFWNKGFIRPYLGETNGLIIRPAVSERGGYLRGVGRLTSAETYNIPLDFGEFIEICKLYTP